MRGGVWCTRWGGAGGGNGAGREGVMRRSEVPGTEVTAGESPPFSGAAHTNLFIPGPGTTPWGLAGRLGSRQEASRESRRGGGGELDRGVKQGLDRPTLGGEMELTYTFLLLR